MTVAMVVVCRVAITDYQGSSSASTSRLLLAHQLQTSATKCFVTRRCANWFHSPSEPCPSQLTLSVRECEYMLAEKLGDIYRRRQTSRSGELDSAVNGGGSVSGQWHHNNKHRGGQQLLAGMPRSYLSLSLSFLPAKRLSALANYRTMETAGDGEEGVKVHSNGTRNDTTRCD